MPRFSACEIPSRHKAAPTARPTVQKSAVQDTKFPVPWTWRPMKTKAQSFEERTSSASRRPSPRKLSEKRVRENIVAG